MIQIVKALLLTILFFCSAFSQGLYLTNENCASAGFFAGKYSTDTKYGFKCSYSIKGFLDLSFTRSSISTKEHINNNFQNEYFVRLYMPNKNRLQFSMGVGYIFQKANSELWNHYPLTHMIEGIALEGGVHLITEDTKTRSVVVSASYLYFEPRYELIMPNIHIIGSTLARSLSIDVSVVYYIGRIGLIIGPKVALDSDFQNIFFGFHSSLMIRH